MFKRTISVDFLQVNYAKIAEELVAEEYASKNRMKSETP
jgi:hypothetical protein